MEQQESLSDAQHVRGRPGMYIGGANDRGLRGMVCGIVQELLDGPGAQITRLTLTLEATDGSLRIEASGDIPLIPPGDLISEPHFANSTSPFLSLTIAAAMCDRMDVKVVRARRKWVQQFGNGMALGELSEELVDEPPRVRVRLRPDPVIFKTAAAEFLPLCGRIRELAVSHPKTVLRLEDQVSGLCREFCYPLGIRSYLGEVEHYWINSGQDDRWHFSLEDGTDQVDAVVLYRCVGPLAVHTFVNGWGVRDGGSHVEGFKQAWAEIAPKTPDVKWHIFGPHHAPGDGCTVVISLKISETSWESSTKDCLAGDRPRELVYRMLTEQWPKQLTETRSET
jgi:DNA gyrase subunit B